MSVLKPLYFLVTFHSCILLFARFLHLRTCLHIGFVYTRCPIRCGITNLFNIESDQWNKDLKSLSLISVRCHMHSIEDDKDNNDDAVENQKSLTLIKKPDTATIFFNASVPFGHINAQSLILSKWELWWWWMLHIDLSCQAYQCLYYSILNYEWLLIMMSFRFDCYLWSIYTDKKLKLHIHNWN